VSNIEIHNFLGLFFNLLANQSEVLRHSNAVSMLFYREVVRLVIAESVSDISQCVNCLSRSMKPYLELLNAKNAIWNYRDLW